MRLIFLDFDGVLNHREWLMRREGRSEHPDIHTRHFDNEIDPACVARVDRIARGAGADVVISSTWRLLHPMEELRKHLRRFGLRATVLGRTPDFSGHRTEGGVWIGSRPRGDEIADWLRGRGSRIEAFVILDDEGMGREDMNGHLVRTSFDAGLTDELAREAHHRLWEQVRSCEP